MTRRTMFTVKLLRAAMFGGRRALPGAVVEVDPLAAAELLREGRGRALRWRRLARSGGCAGRTRRALDTAAHAMTALPAHLARLLAGGEPAPLRRIDRWHATTAEKLALLGGIAEDLQALAKIAAALRERALAASGGR